MPTIFSAPVSGAHVFSEPNQLFDHLSRIDGAILVPADGLFKHLSERTRLNDVAAAAGAEFALQ
jgi:hypothetical protein